VTLPLDGLNGCRGCDPDEIDTIISIVDLGSGSVGRSKLDVAIQTGYEEIEAMEGCQKFEFHDPLAIAGSDIVNVRLERVRHGSGTERCGQPRVSLRYCFVDVGGGQNRNCRGTGRWQQSGD
jgi:hypothetical protein